MYFIGTISCDAADTANRGCGNSTPYCSRKYRRLSCQPTKPTAHGRSRTHVRTHSNKCLRAIALARAQMHARTARVRSPSGPHKYVWQWRQKRRTQNVCTCVDSTFIVWSPQPGRENGGVAGCYGGCGRAVWSHSFNQSAACNRNGTKRTRPYRARPTHDSRFCSDRNHNIAAAKRSEYTYME